MVIEKEKSQYEQPWRRAGGCDVTACSCMLVLVGMASALSSEYLLSQTSSLKKYVGESHNKHYSLKVLVMLR